MPKRIHSVWLISLFLAIQGLFTPNFLLTLGASICLILIFILFWNKNEPSPIFFGLFMQWLTATIELIYSNFLKITLKEKYIYSDIGHNALDLLDYTVWLNLYGIMAFAIGIRLVIRTLPSSRQEDHEKLQMYDLKKLIIVYFFFSILALILNQLAWIYAGASQIILQIINFRYALLFFLIYISFKKQENRNMVFAIILYEFSSGLFSFFAGSIFNVIIIFIMAVTGANRKFSIKSQLFIFSIFIFVLLFGIMWSAIKKDYRAFLNKGQATQSVLVSRDEAMTKLLDLVQNLSKDDLQKGSLALINRIGYITFFSSAINYVPSIQPHENGKVYASAVTHFLVPRFLYPDKPSIDDSEHTSKYTGLVISGKSSATSISLGYLADAYVDFGPAGMAFPLLLFGLFIGFSYRYFYLSAPNLAWSWMLTIPFFFLTNINGTDAIKAIGAAIIYFVFFYLFKNFFIKIINSLIVKKEKVKLN